MTSNNANNIRSGARIVLLLVLALSKPLVASLSLPVVSPSPPTRRLLLSSLSTVKAPTPCLPSRVSNIFNLRPNVHR